MFRPQPDPQENIENFYTHVASPEIHSRRDAAQGGDVVPWLVDRRQALADRRACRPGVGPLNGYGQYTQVAESRRRHRVQRAAGDYQDQLPSRLHPRRRPLRHVPARPAAARRRSAGQLRGRQQRLPRRPVPEPRQARGGDRARPGCSTSSSPASVTRPSESWCRR